MNVKHLQNDIPCFVQKIFYYITKKSEFSPLQLDADQKKICYPVFINQKEVLKFKKCTFII